MSVVGGEFDDTYITGFGAGYSSNKVLAIISQFRRRLAPDGRNPHASARGLCDATCLGVIPRTADKVGEAGLLLPDTALLPPEVTLLSTGPNRRRRAARIEGRLGAPAADFRLTAEEALAAGASLAVAA